MPAFEIGDKVRLIGGHVVGIEDEHNKGYTFKIGDIFEVVNRVSDGCWIEKGFVEIGWNEYFFELVDIMKKETKQEQVHSPKHYNVLEDIEAIQIIASSMTYEMFKGYCLGNILKYRLRCGAKDDVTQELAKADKYKELFAKYNHMCKGEK